jgi:hypothetical protein
VLGDKEKRAAYDRFGKEGGGMPMPGGGSGGGVNGFGGMHGGAPGGFHGSHMDQRRAEDIFAQFFGGEDPFGGMMGGGGGMGPGIRMQTVNMGGGGMPMGMPLGGGMPPGMMFSQGMGPMGQSGLSGKRPAPTKARLDAIRPGTKVTIHSLLSNPQRNGDTAKIMDYDPVKDRYVVQEESEGETLSLKPTNLQQLVPGCKLQGIESEPGLVGKTGTLLRYDAGKDRYLVR